MKWTCHDFIFMAQVIGSKQPAGRTEHPWAKMADFKWCASMGSCASRAAVIEMLPDRFLQVLQSQRFRQTELYRDCNSSCRGSGLCGPAALFFSDFISSHTCGRDEGESHPLYLKHKISVVWSTRLLFFPPASLSDNLKGKQTYTGAGKITHTHTNTSFLLC